MPAIDLVTYDLKGKEVFLAGERVQGTWFVNVSSAVKVNFITTSMIGATYVEWRESNAARRDFEDDKFKAHELYTKQLTSHFSKGNGACLELLPGKYKYPFNYVIPNDKVHSSFEGTHGATRWFIKIEIGLPMPHFNVVKYKCFTYLAKVDIDLPLYAKPVVRSQERKISKAFGIGDGGLVKITASIERSGYCPGEHALLTLDVVNETTKDLGQPAALVMQEVEYKGNGETKIVKECLRSVVGSKLEKGKQQKWTKQKILIDVVPPTTAARSCYCIKCSYYIQVKVPLPFYNGEDIKLRLPITVGTIPQNFKKSQTQQNPPSYDSLNIPVTDLSNSITYTTQKKSSSHFLYSSKSLDFTDITYTPLTAYVMENKPTGANAPQPSTDTKTAAQGDRPRPTAPPMPESKEKQGTVSDTVKEKS